MADQSYSINTNRKGGVEIRCAQFNLGTKRFVNIQINRGGRSQIRKDGKIILINPEDATQMVTMKRGEAQTIMTEGRS